MKISTILFSWATTAHATKQGLALIADASKQDLGLLTSDKSPISWYYTWSPYPSNRISSSSDAEFLPLLHGVDAAEDDNLPQILDDLPKSSRHILTFNEPDHGKDDGGSDIKPKDAAEAYIEYLAPLRDGEGVNREWKVSHPVITSSEKGLEWLRDFNESCWEIDEDKGCPTDFIAVHYYGPFEGLKSWIDQLDEFYNKNGTQQNDDLPFWITEFALPDADADETAEMLNKSMKYLEDEDKVEGYAWFGAFREEDANSWTGDGVSMFDDDGGLTKLGSEYLGGEDNGFEEGEKGEEVDDDDDSSDDEDDAGVVMLPQTGAVLGVVLTVLACLW